MQRRVETLTCTLHSYGRCNPAGDFPSTECAAPPEVIGGPEEEGGAIEGADEDEG